MTTKRSLRNLYQNVFFFVASLCQKNPVAFAVNGCEGWELEVVWLFLEVQTFYFIFYFRNGYDKLTTSDRGWCSALTKQDS